jgi:hypothetical protein
MTDEEKPLTREEALKLIEEHGGPEGLDLSNRNLNGIDLSPTEDEPGLALQGINLKNANLEGANLQGAHLWDGNLQGAYLRKANLQGAILWIANLQGANLGRANLQEVHLTKAKLQGADLRMAKLQGADLRGAYLSKAKLYLSEIYRDTKLNDVDWGPKYVIGDEEAGEFNFAEEMYRNLKQWHTESGIYDIAGEFYFREMTVGRKALKWWPNPLPRALSKFLSILCGYGEKPFRVVVSAAVVVFGMAAIYSISALSFPSALYYSAASFTALGYGLWVSVPEGWVKALGAIEAIVGVFMMALFLITFVRKMTR